MTPEAMVATQAGRAALRWACLTSRYQPGDKDAAFVVAGVVSLEERERAITVLRTPDDYTAVLWHLLTQTKAGPFGVFTQAQADGAVLVGLCGGRRYDVPAAVIPTLLLLLLDLLWTRTAGIERLAQHAFVLCEDALDRTVVKTAIGDAESRADHGALAVLAIRVACATTREELLEACRFDAREYWR